MERQIVLVALSGTGFDLAGEGLARELGPDLRPDRGAVHVLPVTFQFDFQPRVDGVVVAVDPAAGGQVQVAVVVKVCPGCLVSGPNAAQARRTGAVAEAEAAIVVAVQDRVVTAVDRGEEQVQVAVVVVIAKGRRCERLLPGDAAGPLILELVALRRALVAVEVALFLTRVTEVAHKKIEVAVVVNIAPGRANGMGAPGDPEGGGRILKSEVAVIAPQVVGLEAIV